VIWQWSRNGKVVEGKGSYLQRFGVLWYMAWTENRVLRTELSSDPWVEKETGG